MFANIFKIAGKALNSGINFSKTTREISTFYNLYLVHCYVPKSSCNRDFKKVSFNRSCRLTGYNATKKKLLTKFSKGILKILENSHEELCNAVPFWQIVGAQHTAFSSTCF